MPSPEQQLEVQLIEKLRSLKHAHRSEIPWSIRAPAGGHHHARPLHRKASFKAKLRHNDLGLTA